MIEEASKLSVQEQRSKIFGSYKAESLRESIFELFAEPDYFPELTSPSPCVLIGGRGTGKTTVLRCMSYEGQFAIGRGDVNAIPSWPYYGLYYRVNTNRVTAFAGPELDDARWVRTFAHYINLTFCDLTVRFLQWYEVHCPGGTPLPNDHCQNVARALHLDPAGTIQQLALEITKARIDFEAYINNVADAKPISLSMQGAPLDELYSSLNALPQFKGKSFFFLLDEYENFQDYQQQVLNTLIKHGELYSFKVGVRELGMRVRTTLNENEQLVSPADYVRISIPDKLDGEKFDAFALEVSNERISKLASGNQSADIRKVLPGLSGDQEAELLAGESGPAHAMVAELEAHVPKGETGGLKELSFLRKYCIVSWGKAHQLSVRDAWNDYSENRTLWENRFINYSHSLLYTLRIGKRGIRKYYCGMRVFAQMSACNIRYFLELVDQSIAAHLSEDQDLGTPVSPKTQTLAAQRVGKKNLSELEGLSVHGAKLTKLVLGLGRVFQLMAADAFGHTPEVNQFYLTSGQFDGGNEPSEEAGDLLKAAVMHLALLRAPGSKLLDEGDTKEYDYMLHPIFSAFFVFSWRRKRKLALGDKQLLGLVVDHKRTIRGILAAQNRSEVDTLPDQLRLFGPYYNVSED